MQIRIRSLVFFIGCMLAPITRAEVPEPKGYFMGPLHGEVPTTLSGAKVIHSDELAGIQAAGRAILIDAASMPHRPDNLAPDTIWKPLPHENIAGSIWIPGIGEGDIKKNLEAYFRERLAVLTGHDLSRPLVFYCHPNCWASWNAAKRTLTYGYRNVMWYPEGAEGWRDAGHKLMTAEPEPLSQAGP
ncbi:MAG TPA: rhodanese-like domain-containing protein [Methylocella sp.]|nr:rhodanese-like domain-containing protein [Methylocella sp.]